MESWWELGEWSGHSGNTLQVWRITCPFCKEQGNFALAHHAEKQKASSTKKLNFDLYQCKNCMAYVHVFWSAAEHAVGHSLYDFMVMPWPTGKAKPSENWPSEVQRFWIQAHDSLRGENWDAAVVMARSAVQVTMRDKGAVGKDLYNEIEDLAKKGDLPPLMKEWSHEVRVLGNDSAHPKPNAPAATPEDARDVIQFLDSLLLYLRFSKENQRLPITTETNRTLISILWKVSWLSVGKQFSFVVGNSPKKKKHWANKSVNL